MSVVGWLRPWLRWYARDTNDMADPDGEEEDGLDNGDGVDQCVIWWCPRNRLEDKLVCDSNHDDFELVLQSTQED